MFTCILIVALFPGSPLAPTKNFREGRAWGRGYTDWEYNTWWLQRMATARFALLYDSNFLGTGSFSAENKHAHDVQNNSHQFHFQLKIVWLCSYQASNNGPVWNTSIVGQLFTTLPALEWEWDTYLLWAHQVVPVTFLKRWTYGIPVHTKRITETASTTYTIHSFNRTHFKMTTPINAQQLMTFIESYSIILLAIY